MEWPKGWPLPRIGEAVIGSDREVYRVKDVHWAPFRQYVMVVLTNG